MRTTIAIALVACLGAGCKKKHPQEQTSGSGITDTGSGSGAGSGSGSGSAVEKPKTIEEIAKRYEECWKFWSEGRFDQYRGCYASEAIGDAPGVDQTFKSPEAIVGAVREERAAFPDIKGQVKVAIVSGHTAIGMVSLAGTNTGPMRGPTGEMPTTNKKIGITLAIVSELDDQGRAKHESAFFDNATLVAQLGLIPAPAAGLRPIPEITPGPVQALISKDDAAETANRETVIKLADAFTKHDIGRIADLVADDVVWSELAQPKDLDKKGLLAHTQEMWKGFSGLKTTLGKSKMWAAGDHVVAIETFEGWNDGDLAMWNLKKSNRLLSLPVLAIYKLGGGKVKAAWLFYQTLALAQQLGVGVADAGSGSGSAGPAAETCCCELKKTRVEPTGSGAGSGSGSARPGPTMTIQHSKIDKKQCGTLGLCVSPTMCKP